MSQAYLLDTNILSELCKPQPDPKLIQFVAQQAQAWLSIITVHELEYGLNLLPEGNRRSQLAETIQLLLNQYTAFVLPFSKQKPAKRLAYVRRQNNKVGLSI